MAIVKSYLVQTDTDSRDLAMATLVGMTGCTVTPSTNTNLLLLVTDAESEEEDDEIWQKLKSHPDIGSISLVSAFLDEDEENG